MRRSVLLIPWLLTGCLYLGGSGTFGPKLDPGKVALLRPGTTTKADVLALLGPPQEFKRPEVADALVDDTVRLSGAVALGNRAHDVFTYQFDRVDLDGTWLVLFLYTATEVKSDLLVIFFDEHDVVKEVSFREDTRAS
ncbi:MAG: hypothetical protein U1E76_02705 [Planctomycetota bacterium]